MRLHSVPYSPSSSSILPLRSPPLSMPPPRPCAVRHNGQGQDDSPGAREKGDGNAEGQEDESRVIVEVRIVAWLDPGGLDLVHTIERKSGGSGRRGLDHRRVLEAARGRD